MRWVLLLFVAAAACGGERRLLWEIGKADDDTREFALAPGGYAKFRRDAFFVVGASEPRRDWPYVHPGPKDAWAGSRPHAFTIVFALKQKPAGGSCRLLFDLVDTQGVVPPRLRVEVNGRPFVHQMPRGAGDASVSGQPGKGREHRFEFAFPASLLKAGNNQVVIKNVAGSWVLYDWLALEAPAGLELAPTTTATVVEGVNLPPVLVRREGKVVRPVEISVRHVGKAVPDGLEVAISPPAQTQRFDLKPGTQVCRAYVGEATERKTVRITVKAQGEELARREVEMKPLRRWTIYLLPHSHVDIGYTKVQSEVERDHWRFFERAIELGEKTRDYPPGARFKWNVEVLWAVESYLQNASPQKRQRFIQAVEDGIIGLDALYGNELTALCRPEELVQLTAFARRLVRQHGLRIDSAMISDVPGYTWGIVPVLAQSGVRYFSIGPNASARIGYTLAAWADKPFWWLSPSGEEKVLCWIPRRGYWRAFRGEADLMAYLAHLEATGYPYEMVQMRHCLGDNSGPDPRLPDFVRRWNETHAFPRLVIATTSEMFRDFERRYGRKVPVVRGDFTPYWEDGAASSARETALNRAAAERLVQAEALWAMLKPRGFPADDFYQAWRNAILYDEHTWGAHNSVRQPDSPFVKAQWAIKQRFALEADKLSRRLLEAAFPPAPRGKKVSALDVFNTCSWPRTDLVVLDASLPLAGELVKDSTGRSVPSQRLSTGALAFVARDVPPFGAKRFTLNPGNPHSTGSARAAEGTLSTATIRITLGTRNSRQARSTTTSTCPARTPRRPSATGQSRSRPRKRGRSSPRSSSGPPRRAAGASSVRCAWWMASSGWNSSTSWTSRRCGRRRASTSASPSTSPSPRFATMWPGPRLASRPTNSPAHARTGSPSSGGWTSRTSGWG